MQCRRVFKQSNIQIIYFRYISVLTVLTNSKSNTGTEGSFICVKVPRHMKDIKVKLHDLQASPLMIDGFLEGFWNVIF
jgi:hypothetical protein